MNWPIQIVHEGHTSRLSVSRTARGVVTDHPPKTPEKAKPYLSELLHTDRLYEYDRPPLRKSQMNNNNSAGLLQTSNRWISWFTQRIEAKFYVE
jgi:hypothetical protein